MQRGPLPQPKKIIATKNTKRHKIFLSPRMKHRLNTDKLITLSQKKPSFYLCFIRVQGLGFGVWDFEVSVDPRS